MKEDNAVTFDRIDAIQTWLDNVSFSHSKSIYTEREYRTHFNRFCQFIGKTPQQVLLEYEKSADREFKRQYAAYLRAFISHLSKEGYTDNTIKTIVTAVKSFFKYNDLPLGHVPQGKSRVVFHNRDITKEEIVKILNISRPRDRAFFCMMAQTGLRPHTLCQLRLKHIQPDFDNNVIPCKVDVPEEVTKGKYMDSFTFMGPESVKALRDYLRMRPPLDSESYLFTMHGKEERVDAQDVSHRFHDAVKKLHRKDELEYKQKERGKAGTVRLYNLRKFFRKQAGQAGSDFVNFWMSHTSSLGVDLHYFSRDPEHHRGIYREKAMPYLRLELATPSETEKQIEELREENAVMKERIASLEKDLEHYLMVMLIPKTEEDAGYFREHICIECSMKNECDRIPIKELCFETIEKVKREKELLDQEKKKD
jgi:integrase